MGMTGANVKYPEAVGAMSDVPELMNLVTGYYAGDPAAIEAARKSQADSGRDRFSLTNLAKIFPPPPEKHTESPPSPISNLASFLTPAAPAAPAAPVRPTPEPTPAPSTPPKPEAKRKDPDDDDDYQGDDDDDVPKMPKHLEEDDDMMKQDIAHKKGLETEETDKRTWEEEEKHDEEKKLEMEAKKAKERNTASLFGEDDDDEEDTDVSNDNDAPSLKEKAKPNGMVGMMEGVGGMVGDMMGIDVGNDEPKPHPDKKSDEERLKDFHTDGETDKALDNMFTSEDSAVKRLFTKPAAETPPPKAEGMMSMMENMMGMRKSNHDHPNAKVEDHHNDDDDDDDKPVDRHQHHPTESRAKPDLHPSQPAAARASAAPAGAAPAPIDFLSLASTAMKAAKGEATKVDMMKAMESVAPSMGDRFGIDPSMIQMATQGLGAMEAIEGDPASAGKDAKQKMMDLAGPLIAKQMGVDPAMMKMAGPLIGMV